MTLILPTSAAVTGSLTGTGIALAGGHSGIPDASASAYIPPTFPEEVRPVFEPLHGSLKQLPSWLRHITFQLGFQAKSKKKVLLHFTTPSKAQVAITWIPAALELGISITLERDSESLQEAWQRLLAMGSPMNILLRSLGRQIGKIEDHPYTAAVTWSALHDEERPWTEMQLKLHRFAHRQSITLSVHLPDKTTPVQWIEALLEGTRPLLRV